MRFLVRFVENIVKRDTVEKPIGRWFRDSCEKRIARKVDLSNEDHCGTCGEYKFLKADIVQSIPVIHISPKVLPRS